MDQDQVQRTASIIINRHGIRALPKVVGAATHYLEKNDKKRYDYWIKVGYAIKEIQSKNSTLKPITKVFADYEDS